MLTSEENALLTRIGPGTPGGDLLRRYWQPAALAGELLEGGAPLPVRLLGEDLVLFRDEHGRPGLLGIHCSHRGADLSYGRLEDGGLRCIYHGWLYDITGRCLEQPGEPAGSTFRERIRHTAYPCQESGGVIFAYLGPGEPPLVPAYEFLTVPAEQRFVTKLFSECNYLQGNEGNQDPVHLSFLHRINGQGAASPIARDVAPRVDFQVTDWGVRIFAIYRPEPGSRFISLRNTVLPSFTCFGGGTEDGYSVNWHVPIDDTHHWKYTFIFRQRSPLDKDATFRSRTGAGPDYHPLRNKANRYLQDREEMKTRTFAGIGLINQPHDTCVTEGMGPIADRTVEHLAPSDIGIVAARQLMLKALRDVQEGRDPPHVVRRPEENDFPEVEPAAGYVPDDMDHRDIWKPEARTRMTSARALDAAGGTRARSTLLT
jgi:phenylpropionate dioxygenase-like ring-hydroxylating dioxygenase large terminal subunit